MVFLGFQITSLLIIRVGAHRKVPNFFCFFIREKMPFFELPCQGAVKIAWKWKYFEDRCTAFWDSSLANTLSYLVWRRHIQVRKPIRNENPPNQALAPNIDTLAPQNCRSLSARIPPASSSWLACIMAGALERPQWLSEGSRKMKPDTRCYWDLFISELTCWLTAACHFERIVMLDVRHTG